MSGNFVVTIDRVRVSPMLQEVASIRRVPKSKYWIAAFRDGNGRSLTRSTKIPHGGDPAERSRNRKQAQKVADEFEDLSRGVAKTEAAIRKTAFELASITSTSQVKEITITEFLAKYITTKK